MEPIHIPANDRFMDDRDDFPRLLADIGGTNVRFVIETSRRNFEAHVVWPRASFTSLFDAVNAYLSQPHAIAARSKGLRHALFAIANPTNGDVVRMTNADWTFSIANGREKLGLDTLLVVNDFTALAVAIPDLAPHEIKQVGSGSAVPNTVIGLIGPGTGLGVSGLIPSTDGWISLESEGGHASFSPVDAIEIEVLRFAWTKYSHVSTERLVSGAGLELIFQALSAIKGGGADFLKAPDITRASLAGKCILCDEAVELFCRMLGTVAGNLALTLGAKGGVYLGGGIVPRLGNRFEQSGFRNRFEQKGRFTDYLSAIPTYVITAENPALLGASVLLDRAMRASRMRLSS